MRAPELALGLVAEQAPCRPGCAKSRHECISCRPFRRHLVTFVTSRAPSHGHPSARLSLGPDELARRIAYGVPRIQIAGVTHVPGLLCYRCARFVPIARFG